MPSLLKIGIGLSFATGGIFCFAAIAFSLGLGDSSAIDRLGRWATPVWTSAMFLLGSILVLIGVGLRTRAPWSRPLMMGFWAVLALTNIAGLIVQFRNHGSSRWEADLTALFALPVAAWYLFVKENVVAYYEELEASERRA
jgi:hypothetical protein